MDWLMALAVVGGLIIVFAATLALGLWLYDVQPPPPKEAARGDVTRAAE